MDRLNKILITKGILLLSMIIIPLIAKAQMEEGDRGGGGMMGGDGMGMHEMRGMHGMGMDGGMMEMMKLMMRTFGLDLTADQKKKLQRLRLHRQKEAIPLLARFRMSVVELQELALADPVDMENVRAKTKEKHSALAELEFGHMLHIQQVKALLTPDQRQKLESMMMEMRSMMGHQLGRSRERKGHEDDPDMSEDDSSEKEDSHRR
jgi:Spy/CpxP family protein refolding chaperone